MFVPTHMNENPSYKKLIQPKLIAQARSLSLSGRLEITADELVYLKINDAFIHELFPLLPKVHDVLIKPDYFGEDLIGAHISVIYPEEGTPSPLEELDTIYSFQPVDLFCAHLGPKNYYALKVSSPVLTAIRKKYGLSKLLFFKNQWLPFHITIGVSLFPPS